jgi:hypothetical protein
MMNPTQLRISKLAAAGVLAGALLATGLTPPRSSAQTATAPAPATQPAAGADRRSAREDAAAKVLYKDAIQHLQQADLDAATRERLRQLGLVQFDRDSGEMFIRRLTLDLTGRPPTKEEVRVFLADGSADARNRNITQLIAAGPTTAPGEGAAATQPNATLLLTPPAAADWMTALKYAQVADDYRLALRAVTSEPKVKAAYMGVGVDVPNDTVRAQLKLPEGSGLVVNYVDADGPAKDLIHQHDVLQKLDDQLLINGAQLVTLVRMHKPGETLQMTVIREAKPVTVPIKLTEKEVAPLSTYLSEQRGGDPLVSATTAAPSPTVMKVFALRTVDAASALQTINRTLPNDVARGNLNVVSDERTNALVVSGPAEAVKAVDTLVQKLDAPAAKDEKPKK